jgi:hypothetical protein
MVLEVSISGLLTLALGPVVRQSIMARARGGAKLLRLWSPRIKGTGRGEAACQYPLQRHALQ